MASDTQSLWSSVISSIHGELEDRPRQIKNSLWKSIVKGWEYCKKNGVDLEGQIKKCIGNGKSTRFWYDNWCCHNAPLKSIFPRLFALELRKDALVSDRMIRCEGSWKFNGVWRTSPRGRSARELEQLVTILHPLEIFADKEDIWKWEKEVSGFFSVKSLYSALTSYKYREWKDSIGHGWNKWVPGKVNMCVWRGIQNKLPSKDNLLKRGVVLSSYCCSLCNGVLESIDHVIFECPKVVNCWKKVFSWWGGKFIPSAKWEIFKEVYDGMKLSGSSRKVFHGVLCVTVWAIWNWRNHATFALEKDVEMELQKDIFPSIQSIALRWIKARSNKKIVSWASWIVNPNLIF